MDMKRSDWLIVVMKSMKADGAKESANQQSAEAKHMGTEGSIKKSNQWDELIRKKYAKGKIYYVRYADDFLMTFQYKEEAIRVLELLRTRLAKFDLEVAENKTRILPIEHFIGTKGTSIFWDLHSSIQEHKAENNVLE